VLVTYCFQISRSLVILQSLALRSSPRKPSASINESNPTLYSVLHDGVPDRDDLIREFVRHEQDIGTKLNLGGALQSNPQWRALDQ
jgi:hypothetical protein